MDDSAEINSSRLRLVTAADAERRRIERALHDGLQQQLVALAVGLQLAGQMAEADPPGVAALLAQMRRDVHDTIDETRALAQSVYPALLTDRGLAVGLRGVALAQQCRIDVSVVERYSPEVEATVYFAGVELLHPKASMRVWSVEGALHFEVRNDGRTSQHVADRVATVGGVLTVEGPHHMARLPIAAQPVSDR